MKPEGTIVATWEFGADVVQYVWDLVHSHGPVKTGAFRQSARIFADGNEVEGPEQALGAKEVVIMPLVPYARKIERGHPGKKGTKGYAPGKLYEAIAALAKARYHNVAQIKFSYRSSIGSDMEFLGRHKALEDRVDRSEMGEARAHGGISQAART